ncbi:putative fatty acyl-CoA reductase CG5065 [Periplaneta americana]|uniref:putative fatty acyl-CoA reductase CG5065 n=1 Tax=Periplaneta americana TaxID=6978 RepID=UPI0037E87B02
MTIWETTLEQLPVSKDKKDVVRYMELTPIQQFYYGQSVLITGGTGFIGKLLIHKLLTSCVHIHNIYVIIRQKKGEDYKQRHSALLSDKIFDNLRTISPNGLCVLEKVIPINGDVTKPGLGLSDQNRNLLCKEVSMVFHSAATVRFNEQLKTALVTNVIGTQNIVKLCKEMIRLKSLVHVSTSYSQFRNECVEEKLSPPPIDINEIFHLATLPDEKRLTELKSILLKTWPNAYCLTKNLAEQVIKNSELPAAIIRPSIVGSSHKYPTPGWVISSSGAPSMVLFSSLGALHVLNADNDTIVDVIPVDMVVNVMIVAGWRNARDSCFGASSHHPQSLLDLGVISNIAA